MFQRTLVVYTTVRIYFLLNTINIQGEDLFSNNFQKISFSVECRTFQNNRKDSNCSINKSPVLVQKLQKNIIPM